MNTNWEFWKDDETGNFMHHDKFTEETVSLHPEPTAGEICLGDLRELVRRTEHLPDTARVVLASGGYIEVTHRVHAEQIDSDEVQP
jgi:hypothetical protein